MAFQENSTSIQISWSPPTPLSNTTGYIIYYSGETNGSVNVSDGATDSHLLTGLQNGASYTIFIVGTSTHFFSEHVNYSYNFSLSELLQSMFIILRGAHTHCSLPSQFQASFIQASIITRVCLLINNAPQKKQAV